VNMRSATQTACENIWLGSYLFRLETNGTYTTSDFRAAQGTWGPVGNFVIRRQSYWLSRRPELPIESPRARGLRRPAALQLALFGCNFPKERGPQASLRAPRNSGARRERTFDKRALSAAGLGNNNFSGGRRNIMSAAVIASPKLTSP
jgi:hypothetical protein